MPSSDNREHLQQLIGPDYRLQWIIGHGGMSTVWLADDVRGDREVAIKVLRPEFSDNQEFLNRFRNEAQSAQSINSDNVVATYDYRELEDAGRTFCFMALEYVRGESLADLLAREGALPEDLALDVMEQAAHGLSIIHRMGLVHRDIKPGNLLVTQNGKVKITDFGIAKAAAAVPLTRTGMVVGTAQYVSPEQAQGMDVTPASDVYSLGVVGYEMLAGRRPFTGDSSVSVALAHISQEAQPLSTSISAPARELIGIALRKDPRTRFADGNELALAVSAVRLGQRPPQPASAAMAQVAPEPSPTAATHMLAKVAQPSTSVPQRGADQGQPAPRRGFALGVVIVVLVFAVAVGVFALAKTLRGGEESEESTTPPPPTSVVVTEYVEPETTTEEYQPSAPLTTPTPSEEGEAEQPTLTERPRPSLTLVPPAPAPRPNGHREPPATEAPEEDAEDDGLFPSPTRQNGSPAESYSPQDGDHNNG